MMRSNWWLIILLSLIASIAGYQFTDRTERWEAGAVYTVVPKTSGEGAPSGQVAYTDIQATNLFIDVVKSWILDPALQALITQTHPSSRVIEPVHLSMQTFSLRVSANQPEAAQPTLLLADDWLIQTLSRYNQSGQMTQYTILRGEITTQPILPRPLANGGLAGLFTLVMANFVFLFINYYRGAYAHRN